MENMMVKSVPGSPTNVPLKTDEPDLPPGTYEYIDSKKKWKRFFEILALILIAAIPIVLSLYKINRTFSPIYHTISPEDIGPLPSDYQTWSGVITAVQKSIQPIVAPIQKFVPYAPTPTPAASAPVSPSTPTATPTPPPSSGQGSSSQTQEQFLYPTQSTDQVVYPTATSTPMPTATPTPVITSTPTSTPTPTPTQSPIDPAVAACYGKRIGSDCSYSSFGQRLEGKCQMISNTLTCVAN